MMAKRVLVSAMAATIFGVFIGSAPASAQYGGRYYNDDDYDRPRRYERRYEDDDYRRPRPYGRRGSICVTTRGNCPYPPAPPDSGCRCDIPGFGLKRGVIGY